MEERLGLGGLTLSFLKTFHWREWEKNAAARSRLRERGCFPGRMAGVKQLSPKGAGRQGVALPAGGKVPILKAATLA